VHLVGFIIRTRKTVFYAW